MCRFSRGAKITGENKGKSITEELEEMAVNICHNFCKHNNKGKCQWVLEGNICPLRKLY